MFNADDPAIMVPPPPQEGEGAPRFDSEADLEDDGPGGLQKPTTGTRTTRVSFGQTVQLLSG
eukprot:3537736-Pyramimonas_sp.AAC.1